MSCAGWPSPGVPAMVMRPADLDAAFHTPAYLEKFFASAYEQPSRIAHASQHVVHSRLRPPAREPEAGLGFTRRGQPRRRGVPAAWRHAARQGVMRLSRRPDSDQQQQQALETTRGAALR